MKAARDSKRGREGSGTHPEDSRALHERIARSHGARAEKRRHRVSVTRTTTSTGAGAK